MSFFDFASVREDVLSGIYQKIIDQATRKKLGQVYTPHPGCPLPSGEMPGNSTRRPCSSTGRVHRAPSWWNTSRLRHGSQIRRNMVTYDDIRTYFGDIRGNDINSVASSITKMQLLWRLLPFAERMKRELPELPCRPVMPLKFRPLHHYSEWDEIENCPDGQAMGNRAIRPMCARNVRRSPMGRVNNFLWQRLYQEQSLYPLPI